MDLILSRKPISHELKGALTTALVLCLMVFVVPTAFAEKKEGDKKPDLPKDALKALYLAQQAINDKKYDEAVRELNKYLDTAPEKAPLVVYMMLGHCWYQQGNRVEARKAFGKGHDAYPKDRDVLLNYAVLSYETEQFSEAGKLFEKLYRIKEQKERKILFQAAVAYYQGQDLKKAKGALAELLESGDEPDPKWFDMIISICVELKEWQEVERRIVDFLRLIPAQAKYWRLLAQIKLDREDYKAAAGDLEIAYRIELPSDKEWLDLADLYLYLNAPLMAIRCMEEGYKGSIPPEGYRKIADAYARTQRFDFAVKYLDEAFKKDPTARLLFEKGRLLYDAMRYKEAIEVLKECVRMDPKSGEAFMVMGFAAWNLKEWEEARSAFSNASQVPKYREQALQGVAVMDDLIGARSE
jgi:tetratricopeptide (TPR) repeat protein